MKVSDKKRKKGEKKRKESSLLILYLYRQARKVTMIGSD